MQYQDLDGGDPWGSITDLMTGLMAIFLLVALAYMLQLQKNDPIEQHRLIEESIYDALLLEFKQEQEAHILTLDSSLTLRFTEGKVTMFQPGQYLMEPPFRAMLDTILPRFLQLVTRDTLLPHISEIRIEGHANSARNIGYIKDHWKDSAVAIIADSAERDLHLNYEYNLKLSQGRAREVLSYVRIHPSYITLGDKERERLNFLLSATGMSFSRRLDKDAHFAYITGRPENWLRSIRVEFKIVTSRPGALVDRKPPATHWWYASLILL